MRTFNLTTIANDTFYFAGRAIEMNVRFDSIPVPLRLMHLFTWGYCAGNSFGVGHRFSDESAMQQQPVGCALQRGTSLRAIEAESEAGVNRLDGRLNDLPLSDQHRQPSGANRSFKRMTKWQQVPTRVLISSLALAN